MYVLLPMLQNFINLSCNTHAQLALAKDVLKRLSSQLQTMHGSLKAILIEHVFEVEWRSGSVFLANFEFIENFCILSHDSFTNTTNRN